MPTRNFVDATSLEDLIDALTLVIEELESGTLKTVVCATAKHTGQNNKTDQPNLIQVHSSNYTPFATNVRECLKLSLITNAPDINDQRDSLSKAFDHWIENPLECLVEIGAYKLGRDYAHFLAGKYAYGVISISK